ncbi:hypothetical protein NJT12_04115 [Flavobacterium sp. AC]|uniref:Alpha-(1,6)-fucosyltransferase N- and catalytic domain-containing protein n=1 Tax=Flavobacterium azizsancarii TaxID=2961580 RepID=A0ABT4W9L2_9FLAO|nr:hypothetical protein [Flavobacterium azizsancarii]MDA6068799.1 hypothetical protein [Flavobacterium azizsancarii]
MLQKYRQNYKLKNKSFNEKKIIYPLSNRGFFSEVNNLALAVLYCLENDINLKLYSKKWVGGNWKDFFIPLIDEYNGFVPVPVNVFAEGRKDKCFKAYHKFFKKRLIIQDTIWDDMRSENFTNRHFYYPDLGIDGSIFDAKSQILKLILEPNLVTYSEITLDNNLSKLIKDSCGLHIRRGDKVSGESKEAEFVNLETYVNKALQIDQNLTTFTLCTDDFQVVEEFKNKYPAFNIITFCPSYRNGYSQKEYNSRRKKQEKRDEVINILKDCNLLIESKIFVGAFSSNVARYIVLMKNNDKCYSIDDDWSPI